MKFEVEGRELATFLRSLEQFIQTILIPNNNLKWKKHWDLEKKLEKILTVSGSGSIEEGKVDSISRSSSSSLMDLTIPIRFKSAKLDLILMFIIMTLS